ncbi:hypothetical protein LIER_24395 [Lithospermum erythrorhizon]|uniref:Transmembrane protein n=1 Tax=Lithospermum erythrorhizon TaxID=34254 RepID=A0AAV3R223_LITER
MVLTYVGHGSSAEPRLISFSLSTMVLTCSSILGGCHRVVAPYFCGYGIRCWLGTFAWSVLTGGTLTALFSRIRRGNAGVSLVLADTSFLWLLLHGDTFCVLLRPYPLLVVSSDDSFPKALPSF